MASVNKSLDAVAERLGITQVVPASPPPSREEFDALKARMDAFAAHHLQTYGKAI